MASHTDAQERKLEARRWAARDKAWRRSQERLARALTARDGKPRRVDTESRIVEVA